MIRAALLIFLALLPGILLAGTADKYTFTVLPVSPQAGKPFSIKVNVAAGSCYPLLPLFPVSPQGSNVIQFEVVIGDSCTPDLPAQERIYEVPALAAGDYIFRYSFCASNLFGYTCTAIRDVAVTVAPGVVSSAAHTVPTLSWAGASTTMLLMLVVALARMRR